MHSAAFTRCSMLLQLSDHSLPPQCVVVDGTYSEEVHVDSGVPLGTVLGPIRIAYANTVVLSANNLPSHCSAVQLTGLWSELPPELVSH